jgi:hypothetical protein
LLRDTVQVIGTKVPVTSGRNMPRFSVISQLPLTMLSGNRVTMGSEMEGISLG